MTETDLREFLMWFKAETERSWATYESAWTLGEIQVTSVSSSDWQTGTRWQPLSPSEIDVLQGRWRLDFPWDYRLFLEILGVPDRPCLSQHWIDDQRTQVGTGDSFMNWRGNELEIARDLTWHETGIMLSGIASPKYLEQRQQIMPFWWNEAWGKFEPSENPLAAQVKLRAALRTAPSLIPFYDHRFLLPRAGKTSVCLSVMGIDIVLWTTDLRIALLRDFGDLVPERPELQGEALTYNQLTKLPFWGRFL